MLVRLKVVVACWLALFTFVAGLSPASAKTYALLVGVASYDNPDIHDLLGPRNDVTMIWRVLKQRGVDPNDMTVLTDGLPATAEFPPMAGLPQHDNIVGNLDRLAGLAKTGDTVIFYYSGHGTYQPNRNESEEEEPEDYDQVLLPSDSGAFSPIGAGIKNSLVDDDLGAEISKIRKNGAFVWAIVDSCHSGTVTRGDQITRSVDPTQLGVPLNVEPTTTKRSAGTRKGSLSVKEDAGLVGFYAVDATTEAIEQPFPAYNLPMVGEGDKQRMGIFTWHLHRALSKGTALTYRELAQEIVADHVSDSAGGRAPPPVFDGALDQPILGGSLSGPRLLQGIVSRGQIEIPGGVLHGFEPGARIAMFAPGTSDKPIGHATVISATAATSIADDIKWESEGVAVRDGSVPLKVSEPAVTFRFTVSPPPVDEVTPQATAAIETAFGNNSGSADLGIDLDAPGNTLADVFLRVADNRLWILRPERPWVKEAGSFDETPSIDLAANPAAIAEALKQSVWLYARSAKLVRVTGAAATASEGSDEPGIEITGSLTRDPAEASAPRTACAVSQASPLPAEAISPMIPVAAANCDIVEINVTNKSDYNYYIGAFYLSANGEVQAMKRADVAKGCVRTLPARSREPITYKLRIQTWDSDKNRPSSIGIENAVILAIPQDDTNIAPRLCSLIQPSVAAMQEKRGVDEAAGTRGRGRALSKLISGINGTATRGSAELDDGDEDEGPPMGGKLFVFDLKP